MQEKSKSAGLTDRMKLCCHWAALLGDRRAAVNRVYQRPEHRRAALEALASPEARRYLAGIRAAGKREPEVLEGYRRLAFGSVSDAVKLMFMDEEAPPDIDKLDLFNVSGLRRGKGALEISFFDRLDALDRLARKDEEAREDAGRGFYDAVLAGAAALEGRE